MKSITKLIKDLIDNLIKNQDMIKLIKQINQNFIKN